MSTTFVLSRLVNEIAAAEEFFGRPLDKVDPLLRQIKATSDPIPEWLRGARYIQDLPRYARIGAKTASHRIALPGIRILGVASRVAWVVEHCGGPWKVQHTMNPALYFVDLRDAVHYRLRWSHER